VTVLALATLGGTTKKEIIHGLFTLAKFSAITQATVTATHNSHYLPWQHDISRNYPIRVVSPKVAKASKMVTMLRVAVTCVIALNFANVNTAYLCCAIDN
jgi:hypothetical protein